MIHEHVQATPLTQGIQKKLRVTGMLTAAFAFLLVEPCIAQSQSTTTSSGATIQCSIIAVCPTTPAYEGAGVAIHVGSIIESGSFQSLDLLSMRKGGLITAPANAPVITGLGGIDAPKAEELILFWKTSSGDAGSWEICFEARDEMGGADTCCHTTEVRVPDLDHVAWNSEHIQFAEGDGPFDHVLALTTTHDYDSTYGIVISSLFSTATGSAFLADPLSISDISFPSAYQAAFESQSVNTYGGEAVSTDTLLMGLIDFGGPSLGPGSYDITVDARIRDSEGVIQIDTVGAFLDNQLIYHVTGGAVVAPTFAQGCFAVTVGRCTISMTGDVNQSGTLTAADFIALVNRLFRGGSQLEPCDAVADVNCDGALTAVDILRIVNYMFKSGTPPCDVCWPIWDGVWPCP